MLSASDRISAGDVKSQEYQEKRQFPVLLAREQGDMRGAGDPHGPRLLLTLKGEALLEFLHLPQLSSNFGFGT